MDSREKEFVTRGNQGRLNRTWSSEKLPDIGPGLHSQLLSEIEEAQLSRGRAPGLLHDAKSEGRSEDEGRGHELSVLHVGQHISPSGDSASCEHI